MKRLFLIQTFILFRVVATDTAVPVLDDEASKFSSIVITAPGTAAPPPPHAVLELPNPMRKYKAEGGHPEPFGYGHLFTYNTDCDFGDISIPFTHRNILERLREYKEAEHRTGKYEDSNLLLVRVRFVCITPTKRHSFECFFGLFSSGVTKKYDCKTISQTYAGQQFPKLNEPLKREFIGRLLLENRLLHEYCLLDRMQEIPIVDYDADVYPYKLFKLNGYTVKRVIFSNADYVKSDKPHKGFNKNLLERVLQRLRIPSEAVEGYCKTYFDYTAVEGYCKTYFGCTAKDLFEREDKVGTYFNQSEQAFFNSLETDDVEAFFGSTAPRISESAEATEAASGTASAPAVSAAPCGASAAAAATSAAVSTTPPNTYIYNARVDMYSYRDICVVCRGYIARLLENGWLTDNIREAMRKKSDVRRFEITPITSVYAHSAIDTDVHIETSAVTASSGDAGK